MNQKILNKVFNNTQNSYKFYWWLSIIEISTTKEKNEISFDEIVIQAISKLWYPVNYYKLSFGKLDQCSKFIKQLKLEYYLADDISESDLFDFLIKHKNSILIKKISRELTRYVPYRFIRPWYSDKMRGLKDSQVNKKILKLQNEEAPYQINFESKSIVINNNWLGWINRYFKLLISFTYFELIKYLEKENPNTSSISKKLEKPLNRNLSTQTKYWKKFILEAPIYNDVFGNKPLVSLKQISIDHFLPWSFVAHDLIWNLHPVEKSVNSSKSNCLPSSIYFEKFYSLQYNFCNFLTKGQFNKPLENYYVLFNCSLDNLKNLSKEQFIVKMKNYYSPQVEIAKNMGFSSNWNLN